MIDFSSFTRLITSELANQRAPKALFTCVVHTNITVFVVVIYVVSPKLRKRALCGGQRLREGERSTKRHI